ncbi:hypothetical protein ACQKP6_20700 [Pseudomonas fluorescens]|uniref:hypothetical protein n=1 Tax=Pseudomonas fluorescens TaxID=294 RepID=UPI003D08D228
MQSKSDVVQAIKDGAWWQGAVIAASRVEHLHKIEGVDFWVVASQTCNLYNQNFEKIPSFEVLAAKNIGECNPQFIKGDNPRILHLEAICEESTVYLEIDIQTRAWLPREAMAGLTAPDYLICDAFAEHDPNWIKKQWLDLFSGWIGRSYTRVALPDDFNTSLNDCRVKEVIEKKLTKHANDLYGIYISLLPDSEGPWNGILGLMPPPYQLSILLITYMEADLDSILSSFKKQLFNDKIASGKKDDNGKPIETTRAELAASFDIRIIKQGVQAMTIGEVSLLDLKQYVRYSLIDHHSNSMMATGI